jgi:hypothetical protein
MGEQQMKGGNGVLLLGAGVFLLILAWTGKFAEIWGVISGNLPENPVDVGSEVGKTIHDKIDEKIHEPEPGPPAKTRCVILDAHPDTKTTVLEDEMSAPDGDPNINGGCRSGYLSGMQCQDGLHVCVKTVRGAGFGKYAYDERPTGRIGLRLMPYA